MGKLFLFSNKWFHVSNITCQETQVIWIIVVKSQTVRWQKHSKPYFHMEILIMERLNTKLSTFTVNQSTTFCWILQDDKAHGSISFYE